MLQLTNILFGSCVVFILHEPRLEYVIDAPGVTRVSSLDPQEMEYGAKGALHLAFQSLFAEPFGAADVDDFVTEYGSGPTLTDRGPAENDWRSLAWVLSGVTAAGLGAGVTLGLLAEDRVGSVPPYDPDYPEARREAQRFSRAANVSYAVAGLCALGAGVLQGAQNGRIR